MFIKDCFSLLKYFRIYTFVEKERFALYYYQLFNLYKKKNPLLKPELHVSIASEINFFLANNSSLFLYLVIIFLNIKNTLYSYTF